MKPTTKFEIWLEKVNAERKAYWEKHFSYKPYEPLTYTKGRKFVKIMDEGRVWAFVSMEDGFHKTYWIKVGDLMKPASYRTPAMHSRGNIFTGTAKYDFYGPAYLKR